MSSVSISNLVVTRSGYPALANGSFELPNHHFTLVTGKNGSGKTTLLKAICGISAPQRGKIEITTDSKNADSENFRTLRSSAVYVGHNALYMRHISVIEHLKLCKQLDVDPETQPKYVLDVEQVIEMFELDLRKNVRVEDLSAGQQRRLHLASALVRSPELLCVDEPHSSLDEKSKDAIDSIFADQFEAGRSFLVATHDPQRLTKVATHNVELKNGVASIASSKSSGAAK